MLARLEKPVISQPLNRLSASGSADIRTGIASMNQCWHDPRLPAVKDGPAP
jgi:hypothetical protein